MQLCVALMRDTSKVVALSRSSTPFAKNEIRVYSSSGEGVLSFSVLPIYPLLISNKANALKYIVEPRENSKTRLDP